MFWFGLVLFCFGLFLFWKPQTSPTATAHGRAAAGCFAEAPSPKHTLNATLPDPDPAPPAALARLKYYLWVSDLVANYFNIRWEVGRLLTVFWQGIALIGRVGGGCRFSCAPQRAAACRREASGVGPVRKWTMVQTAQT